ncbi:MAG: neutral/alkaline non-lysosomal ceramidase N-terminal domain-containing protein [Planctomycetaceae bacterium]|nr:neutral/alkaline non-lysosomal ceramidase N-terminal domain-containing protein [Planctomycetales bacterium]MCB9925170.1 neutral/alkaline non-lysosomal ceramidase N-terminal domain-containing protein [Planctomycetaceae bacterium]
MGVAEVDITPPVGFPMAGYYHERLATGSRDPLKAKAMVFRQGETKAAFVVADLTGIARDLCEAVRRKVSTQTAIPPKHIVVSATHSHTAPDYTGRLYEFLVDEGAADSTDAYPQMLIDGIVTAVVRANEALRPVTLTAGVADQSNPVSFNRRFVMRDGSVRTWQRYDNPDVVRAAGPIDPEISILTIRGANDDEPSAVLSNFALHLDTVGGHQWSGDYPYYIEQSLRRRFGEGLISLFGLGACGDINHSDPSRAERNKTDVIGDSLAATIDSTLPNLKTVETFGLQVRSATVDFPLQKVSQRELERATQLIPAAKSGEKIDFFDLVAAYKAVMLDQFTNKSPQVPKSDYLTWGLSHTWAGIGDSLPVEVTTITIGREVAMVFLPGEVFVELGLAIKRGSPYRTTFVIELSNCVETIYIPTRAAYAGGSYEVSNAAGEPGNGEMLVEASLKLLRESASSN